MVIGTRTRFRHPEGESSSSLTASLGATKHSAQAMANVVRRTTIYEDITMATKLPPVHVSPRNRTRRPNQWTPVVRWAGLWACILSLGLIAPSISAGSIPNADDGGGGASGSGSTTSGPHQTVSRLFDEVFTQQKG
jgi:hypothetical protein